MAIGILRDQTLYFDGYELTTISNSVALEYSADAVDATVLGNTTRSRLGGLKDASCGIDAFYNPNTMDADLFASLGVENKIISVCAGDSLGDITYSMQALMGEYNHDASIGEVHKLSLNAMSDSPLVRGVMMLNSKASPLTSSGNGTARQVGAVGAAQTLYAGLHVLNAGTGSITFTLKSDATNSFSGGETTRITFDAATAIGSQFKTAAGAITDTWYRPSYTISGASPSFQCIITLGIL